MKGYLNRTVVKNFVVILVLDMKAAWPYKVWWITGLLFYFNTFLFDTCDLYWESKEFFD